MAANNQRSYPRRTDENWERSGEMLKYEFTEAGLHENLIVADFDFRILAKDFYSSYKNWVAEQDREYGRGPNDRRHLDINDLFAYTNIFYAIPYEPFHIWFDRQADAPNSEAQLRTLIEIFKIYMQGEEDLYDQQDNAGRLIEVPDDQHEIVDHLVEEPAETNLPRAQGVKRSRSRKHRRSSKVKKVRRSHKRKKTKSKKTKSKKTKSKKTKSKKTQRKRKR